MIVFDLCCLGGHRFEGWFSSSEDFAEQRVRDLVVCPQCGSPEISKAPMAPAVGKKGNQATAREAHGTSNMPVATNAPPPEMIAAMEKLAAMQAEALKDSKWVGESFAEQSRAMHYGEREARTIHGKASPHEAKELIEEGISVMPLPFPVATPDELN